MKTSTHPLIGLIATALLALTLTTACDTADSPSDERFTNHGVAVPLSESRGIVATQDGEGRPGIVVLANNYDGPVGIRLLHIDAQTGEAQQLPLPSIATENTESTYELMRASTGIIYTSLGQYLVGYDPEAGDWHAAADMGDGTSMSFAETQDGTIYTATYPNSILYHFNPETEELTKLGQVDPSEKYPSKMAIDQDGIVYIGLGTQNSNLVAYNPETETFTQLVDDADRKVARADVYRGDDGHTYGRLSNESPWLRLSPDDAVPVDNPPPRVEDNVIDWGSVLRDFPDGGQILAFDLPGSTYRYEDANGETHEQTFTYRSDGAGTTKLGLGPEGAVYGSSSHPLRAFRYRPGSDKIEVLGGVDRIGGGNFRSFVPVGNSVYMLAYLGGDLFRYDTTQPWVETEGDTGNPRFLASYERQVARPRAMAKHPHENVLVGVGFPGYGYAGGGLALYYLDDDRKEVIPNDRLLSGLSTITLDFDGAGNVVGGTSVRAPGGAEEAAEEASIYVFDWSKRTIAHSAQPVDGTRDYMAVRVTEAGNIMGVTGESMLFLYDPAQKTLIEQADLSKFGNPLKPDQSLARSPAGTWYLVLEKAVFTVNPETLEHTVYAKTPVDSEAGIAITEGRLYFTAGPELWSVRLTE